MSIADDISKRNQDAIKPAAAYFFNQTSGIIEINNGHNSPSLIGAQEFVPAAYIALKEHGIDLRFEKNTDTITEAFFQAYIGNIDTKDQPYVLQHKDSYMNALSDTLQRFDRLNTHTPKKNTTDVLNGLFRNMFHM